MLIFIIKHTIFFIYTMKQKPSGIIASIKIQGNYCTGFRYNLTIYKHCMLIINSTINYKNDYLNNKLNWYVLLLL